MRCRTHLRFLAAKLYAAASPVVPHTVVRLHTSSKKHVQPVRNDEKYQLQQVSTQAYKTILILRFCTNGFCYSKTNWAVYTTIISAIKYISNCDKAEFVTSYGLWLMADTQNLLAFENQSDVLPVSLEMTLSARESVSVFAVSCILVWADVHWCLHLCTPWTKIWVATLERLRYTKLSAFFKTWR